LFLAFSVLTLLPTASPLLTVSFDRENTIPLGTFITWAGLIAMPLSIYLSIKELRLPTKSVSETLSVLIKIIILLAVLWVPVSFALGGNICFIFTEKAAFQGSQEALRWFWQITYAILIGALSVLFLYCFSMLFTKN